MRSSRGSSWCEAVGAIVAALAVNGSVATAGLYCVPGDFNSIQEAIDAVSDNDEICVGPGTYYEQIDFLGKAIRLYSTHGPGATIIGPASFSSPPNPLVRMRSITEYVYSSP